jgi:hypothetical protein
VRRWIGGWGWGAGGRYIDDGCFATVRDMMTLNNMEILGHLEADTRLLRQIFNLCRHPPPLHPILCWRAAPASPAAYLADGLPCGSAAGPCRVARAAAGRAAQTRPSRSVSESHGAADAPTRGGRGLPLDDDSTPAAAAAADAGSDAARQAAARDGAAGGEEAAAAGAQVEKRRGAGCMQPSGGDEGARSAGD